MAGVAVSATGCAASEGSGNVSDMYRENLAAGIFADATPLHAGTYECTPTLESCRLLACNESLGVAAGGGQHWPESVGLWVAAVTRA